MLNNLGNVSLDLISIANIVRFLGFPLYLVCFVHRNNVFKSFCFGCENGVSGYFLSFFGIENVLFDVFRLFMR